MIAMRLVVTNDVPLAIRSLPERISAHSVFMVGGAPLDGAEFYYVYIYLPNSDVVAVFVYMFRVTRLT